MDKIDHAICLKDGRILSVLEQGKNDGKPVIYLHGAPGSYREHDSFEDNYQQQGLRFISVNRPGVGASHVNDNWNALTFADDLLQVANHLKIDKAMIVGFSAGGLYGCAFAYKYPERVEKLALLASVSPYDIVGKKLSEATRAFYDSAKHNPEALLKQLSGVTTPNSLLALIESTICSEDKRLFGRSHVRENLLNAFSDVLNQGLMPLIKEVSNIASPWGFSPKDILTDTHIWHGTADSNVPTESSVYLAETIPAATTTFIDGVGHYFSFDDWNDILNQVVSS